MSRIAYIDGLRGIAILMVILFHAYSRWADTLYGVDAFTQFPLFKYGYLGVQLFFLISGFVILMTLEKSKNLPGFIFRRWSRLFPAMAICSFIIFSSSNFFYERPNGIPNLIDLLPGLTFVEPYYWNKLLEFNTRNLEGVFWSIYIEFKFYIVAALIYFNFKSKHFVLIIFIFFMSWFTLEHLNPYKYHFFISIFHSITFHLGFKYFGWFASGAAFYLYTKSHKINWFFYGLIISIISSFSEGGIYDGKLWGALLISLFFALSICSLKLQSMMKNKTLLFFGFISYPMYLLHENMMISSSLKLSKNLLATPNYLLPIFPILMISLLSYIIAKKIEPLFRQKLTQIKDRLTTLS